MTIVYFLLFFISGNFYFFYIDDHYIITAIKITNKIWFFLTHQKLSNFCCLSTKCLSLQIKHVPISFNISNFSSLCYHLSSFLAALLTLVFVSFEVFFF